MKVKLELEVDWIDEDYNLDDTVKQEVIASLVNGIRAALNEEIDKEVGKMVSIKLDEWIMEQLHLFCDRNINVTDKWGDTTEHHESVTDMFKAKFDSFFNATVDETGKTIQSCGYGNKRVTRIDHMLNKKAAEYLKKITDDMDYRIKKSIDKETKAAIEAKIKKHVLAKVTDMAT